MRIVFIGAVKFSLNMLQTLIEQKADIAGVITAEAGHINSDFADLRPICLRDELPMLAVGDINSEEVREWIIERKPDVIFCFGWSRLIGSAILRIPPKGVVGYHPAALPKNRGRHPVIWSLVLGLTETASTFFLLNDGVDSGDILSQVTVLIKKEDNASSLYDRLIKTAKKQLVEMLPLLENGAVRSVPQDHSSANVWRKRVMRDGQIDWRMSSDSIYNLVRGLTHPYVGAHIMVKELMHKVWLAKMVECHGADNMEPGKVVDVSSDGSITVKCGHGCIKLLEIDPKLSVEKGAYI